MAMGYMDHLYIVLVCRTSLVDSPYLIDISLHLRNSDKKIAQRSL